MLLIILSLSQSTFRDSALGIMRFTFNFTTTTRQLGLNNQVSFAKRLLAEE